MNCINSLIEQSVYPNELIIICHKDDFETRSRLNKLCLPFNFKILTVNAGVCTSRNKGIENSNGGILVFLEDDILLPRNYLESVLSIFKDDRINVVTGYVFDRSDLCNKYLVRKNDIEFLKNNIDDSFFQFILNNDNICKINIVSNFYYRFIRKIIKYIFIMDSRRPGVILPSGYKSEMPEINKIGHAVKVQWLFGGNFAARRFVFDEYFFNTDLEKYGLAINEDLELSSRLLHNYDIILSPDLIIYHLKSDGGYRMEPREKYISFAYSLKIISDRCGSKPAYYWGMIGYIISIVFNNRDDDNRINNIKEMIKIIII